MVSRTKVGRLHRRGGTGGCATPHHHPARRRIPEDGRAGDRGGQRDSASREQRLPHPHRRHSALGYRSPA